VGNVTNLAQRLSAEAKPGQILVSQRIFGAIESAIESEGVGELVLKGYSRPVAAYNVVALRALVRPTAD
jgi:adenylate cyclase